MDQEERLLGEFRTSSSSSASSSPELLQQYTSTMLEHETRNASKSGFSMRKKKMTSQRSGYDEPIEISLLDRLLLSSWEKWKRHKRFPYKILLHGALLLLTLTQIITYDSPNAAYIRSSQRNWQYFFQPPLGMDKHASKDQEYSTLKDTMKAFAHVRDAYYSISDVSIANYRHYILPNGSIAPVKMLITEKSPSHKQFDKEYKIFRYQSSFGPLSPAMSSSEQRDCLRKMKNIVFTFRLREEEKVQSSQGCAAWNIDVRFVWTQDNQMRSEVDASNIASCAEYSRWEFYSRKFVWIHALISFLCCVYLLLCIRAIIRSTNLISQATEILRVYEQEAQDRLAKADRVARRARSTCAENQHGAFQSLTTADSQDGSRGKISLELKLRLFNMLQLMIATALSLLLISSLWSLYQFENHIPLCSIHRLLYGTSVLVLWISSVGYLEHNPYLYSIVLTLQWAIPRVAQFLFGVFPIFFGYALFGTIFFGPKVEIFGTIISSMVTLFAVMNGDVILDTFDALSGDPFDIVGKFYLFSFIALSIYVVLNIFVALVEEAFFATRTSRRMLDVILSYSQHPASHTRDRYSSDTIEMLHTIMEASKDRVPA